MKRFLLLLFIFLSAATIGIYADESNGSTINFIKSDKEHKALSKSVGLSVDSFGDIAIGFEDDSINVYDKNGTFKHAFNFDVDGSYFFEFDKENNIMIFTVRGDSCYYFNNDATLIKTIKISDPVESDLYYLKHASRMSIGFQDTKYTVKQTFGYTKLIRTDINGKETTIYEDGFSYISKLIKGLAVLIFAIMVIYTTSQNVMRSRKKQKTSHRKHN